MNGSAQVQPAAPLRKVSSTSSAPGGRAKNVVFVTGTDTGVGKTVLTALLLCFLRQEGHRALAVKPFCAGDRADVDLLHDCQDAELSREEISPFHFEEPVAPAIAARLHGRRITLRRACAHVHWAAARCDWLLVEGCGGLMVPLGDRFLVADWIAALSCPVVVVAPNRIGVINHSILTINALRILNISRIQPILLNQGCVDASCKTNASCLAELLAPLRLFEIPFLGRNAFGFKRLRADSKKLKKVLAQIWTSVTVAAL